MLDAVQHHQHCRALDGRSDGVRRRLPRQALGAQPAQDLVEEHVDVGDGFAVDPDHPALQVRLGHRAREQGLPYTPWPHHRAPAGAAQGGQHPGRVLVTTDQPDAASHLSSVARHLRSPELRDLTDDGAGPPAERSVDDRRRAERGTS